MSSQNVGLSQRAGPARAPAHDVTKIRLSIEAWIWRGRGCDLRVLLLHVPAAHGGDHPDYWQPVTGGVEAAESHPAAAVREIAEETALTVSAADLVVVIDVLDVPITPELTVRKRVFVIGSDVGEVSTNPDEHDDYQWCKPGNVASVLRWESNRITWDAVRSQFATG